MHPTKLGRAGLTTLLTAGLLSACGGGSTSATAPANPQVTAPVSPPVDTPMSPPVSSSTTAPQPIVKTYYLPAINTGERLMSCRSQRNGIRWGTLTADGKTIKHTGFIARSPGQLEQETIASRNGGTIQQARQASFDALMPEVSTDQVWRTSWDSAANRSGQWTEQYDAAGVIASIYGDDQYNLRFRCTRTQALFLPAQIDNTQATVSLSFNSNDVPPALYSCRIGDAAYVNWVPSPQVLATLVDFGASSNAQRVKLFRSDGQGVIVLPADVSVGAPTISGTAEGRPFECTTIDRIAQ